VLQASVHNRNLEVSKTDKKPPNRGFFLFPKYDKIQKRFNLMIKKERGITLIELLVVMTVIMVLASLIVASMKKNRENAMDVRTITALEQVRVVAEFVLSRDGKYNAICGDTNKLSPTISELNDLQAEIDLNAGINKLTCRARQASINEYCVSVELKNGGYWCINGEGKSGKATGPCSGYSCVLIAN